MANIHKKYKLVLGLEIHMHVKTDRKMFCGCSTDIYGVEPNTRTCPTCLGLPGALPVANADAVKKAQLLGLALNCKINEHSKFDRKHYFYHDLPKAYQISQYKQPFCVGQDEIIERIHLEEDTAKSFHKDGKTLVDFNKSGMPLIELVTKPVFKTGEDAANFGRELRDLVRIMGVSDADMEKGQLRVEPNISLRTPQMEEDGVFPDYKVEIKNINSFKYMEKAVNYEIDRQAKLLDAGTKIPQENRGWNEKTNKTVAQRTKEDAHDYRYFPEPDIPPFYFDEEYMKDLIRDMPEVPAQKKQRFIEEYKLTEQRAQNLTSGTNMALADEFEALAKELKDGIDPVEPNDVAKYLLNKPDFRGLSVKEFRQKFKQANISITNEDILIDIVKKVIEQNQDAVEKYKNGKESIIKFLVGQVMCETKGKADAKTTEELILEQIKK